MEALTGAAIIIGIVILLLLAGRSIAMWWTGINDVKTLLKINNFLLLKSMDQAKRDSIPSKVRKSIDIALKSDKF